MFFQRKDKFYAYLLASSSNLKECSIYFSDHIAQKQKANTDFINGIDKFRKTGEEIVSDVSNHLQKAFITPLEREDILHLVQTIYNILKKVELCSDLFYRYSITYDDHMFDLSSIAKECTEEIDLAVRLITEKKLVQINKHVFAIHTLEAKGEESFRRATQQLLKKNTNPIQIIKCKEIYDSLIHIIYSCQAVATTFQTIILKNG